MDTVQHPGYKIVPQVKLIIVFDSCLPSVCLHTCRTNLIKFELNVQFYETIMSTCYRVKVALLFCNITFNTTFCENE